MWSGEGLNERKANLSLKTKPLFSSAVLHFLASVGLDRGHRQDQLFLHTHEAHVWICLTCYCKWKVAIKLSTWWHGCTFTGVYSRHALSIYDHTHTHIHTNGGLSEITCFILLCCMLDFLDAQRTHFALLSESSKVCSSVLWHLSIASCLGSFPAAF